jgi:hypothetical protein
MHLTLSGLAVAFLAVALASFALGVRAVRRRQLFGSTVSLLAGALLLTAAALATTLALAVQGYRAFTREDVAAVVETRPTGVQTFNATFTFPDGDQRSFSLAGDVLKWKPIANVLGLHTAYALDRVAGRYVRLEDERARRRTVYSLKQPARLDLFELRRRFPLLRPLVDAEYGSATFAPANARRSYEIRVSISGLLIRPAADSSAHLVSR